MNRNPPARPRRFARGFSLLELMVASTLGIIIVAGASTIAVAMTRHVWLTEDQQTIDARFAMAHAYLERTLANVGYLWPVSNFGDGEGSGSFGAGVCLSETNLCSENTSMNRGEIYPIWITGTGDADETPDLLHAIVPRDPVTETVQIVARGSTLPGGAFSTNTNCGGSGGTAPANPQPVIVNGTNRAWQQNDLLLVSNLNGRAILTRAAQNFGAGVVGSNRAGLQFNNRTTTALTGTTPANVLRLSDGGRTADCTQQLMYLRAHVMRVKQVRVRLDTAKGELQVAEVTKSTEATGTAVPWRPVIDGVDDFQVRFVLAKMPQLGDATPALICHCNDRETGTGMPGGAENTSSSIFNNRVASLTKAKCAGCGLPDDGDRLRRATATRPGYRVLGLEVGLVLSGSRKAERAPVPYVGMFDRTKKIGEDAKTRRRGTFFVGITNAHAL